MKYAKLFIFASLVSLAGVSQTHAGDAAAGKAKAVVCAACHGIEGISSNDEWPNLAGQKEAYLANQLKNFKSGERKSALMAPMAAGLSDTDIANLAAYFSSL